MSKVYRVNMKTKKITSEELKKEYRLFGNRGLVAKVMNDEVDPKCAPLGPGNKLIVCTGLFAGTAATGAHRVSIGGKSPLTGTIKESNVGGEAGYLLGRHGIKMIIFEDLPPDDQWSLFTIDKNGTAKLLPADEYVGLNNYALVEKLKKQYGDGIGVLSIGVAGERMYNTACVMVTKYKTGHPSRAAGRGGLGAVWGSKKLKAIVIEEPAVKQEIRYADKERFLAAQKKLADAAAERMKNMTKAGTMGAVDITAAMAVMPVRNFRGGFFDKVKQINTEAFLARVAAGGGKASLPCMPGCVVRCSNIINNDRGEYVTSSFEYETAVLFGPNCEIGNLDFLAEMDRICDDLGVDTMETANTIAMCMEAGKIPWGDEEAVRGLMKELVDGTEFGNLLGKGTAAVGKALGVKRIPVVKGQSMSGYDPRNLKGIGVTYATSPMGADHTCGITLAPGMDHTKKEGQVELSGQIQMVSATADNCLCLFNFLSAAQAPDILPEMFAGLFGGEWDLKKVIGLGAQTIMLEKAFNRAAGFTEKDDRLPEFFYQEKAAATGAIYDITPDEMAKVFPF